MHEDPTYISYLGGLMEGYVREKRSVGYKFTKGASLLRQLDLLIAKEQLEKMVLTKETVMLWTRKRPNEQESTRIGRICLVRGFAEYMVRLGYEAYIFSKLATSLDRYSYVPYIFSKEEIRNIFIICDSYPISGFSPNRHLILPLLFRMLYGCGLRISEAVSIKNEDVDLVDGTLTIRDAKFGKNRIVPMAESLIERCRQYAKTVHVLGSSSAFFFPSPYGGHYSEATVYKLFREILWKAKISHTGEGPRLHDFRHS